MWNWFWKEGSDDLPALYVVTLSRFGREPATYPYRSFERAFEMAQTFIKETTKAVAPAPTPEPAF